MLLTKTLQNYLDFIKHDLGIETTEDNLEWSDDLIIDKINYARQEFFTRMQYHNREGSAFANSVIDTAAVLIPQTIATISFLRYYNGSSYYLLDYISEDQYLRRTSTAQSGQPIEWTRRGGSVYLYPAAGSSVTNGVEFYGRLNLTELTAVTDIDTNIENRYFGLICDLALAECWAHAEQWLNANPRYQKFEKFFTDHAFEILSNQTGQDVSTEESPRWLDETDPRRLNHLT